MNSRSFEALKARKLDLLAQGRDLIDLMMINPDLAPAQLLVDRLAEASVKSRNHRYSASRGVRKLREAFAAKYEHLFKVSLDPDTQICVTMGMKDALYQALRCVTKAGDTVLVPAPTYPAYLAALQLLELRIDTFSVDQDSERMFHTIEEKIRRGLCRAVILNFPNNPTGACVSREFMRMLACEASAVGCILLNDFVYGELGFGGQAQPSLLRDSQNLAGMLEVYSMSKAYNIPGWRVAALVGDANLVAKVVHLKEHLDYGIFFPIQIAAAAGLLAPEHITRGVADCYARRTGLLRRGLDALGFQVWEPNAGASVWAELPTTSRGMDSFAFVDRLMSEGGVFVMPGELFGAPYERFIRIAAVQSEEKLLQALAEIEKCLPTVT